MVAYGKTNSNAMPEDGEFIYVMGVYFSHFSLPLPVIICFDNNMKWNW